MYPWVVALSLMMAAVCSPEVLVQAKYYSAQQPRKICFLTCLIVVHILKTLLNYTSNTCLNII